MSIKASVYIAASLDGFIARDNGDLDWLLGASTSTDDHGYAEFMQTIDALVMGRGTYEKVLTFDDWPYAGKRVIVLSRTLTPAEIPESLSRSIEVHPGPVRALVEELAASGAAHIYVDGGKVVQSFLAAGLLDELTITRIPVLIGSGLPLFGATDRDIRLDHVRTRAFDSGFVQSTYRVAPWPSNS